MSQSQKQPAEERRRYLEGIALFNQQRYFEAHEVWEELWKHADGKPRLFYQGLIQCAVSLEHMKRGNASGARSLFRRCQKRLAPLPPVFMELDIWLLMEATAKALAPGIDPPGKNAAAQDLNWPIIRLRTQLQGL